MEYYVTLSEPQKIGQRERDMADDLMVALRKGGLPQGFANSELTISMNVHSGAVFLTNGDGQVAMMNDLDLEEWFICPNCDAGGFADDIEWDAIVGLCGNCADEDDE